MFKPRDLLLLLLSAMMMLCGCSSVSDPDPLAYQTRPMTLFLQYSRADSHWEGLITLDEEGGISLCFIQPQTLAGMTICSTPESWELLVPDGSRIPLHTDEPYSDPAIVSALFSLNEEQLSSTEADGKRLSAAVYTTELGSVILRFADGDPLPITIEVPELNITVNLLRTSPTET